MKNKLQPMQTIWRSLLWKEWHEHKWKLLALSTILVAAPMAGSLIVEKEAWFEILSAMLLPYAFLAGLFVAMGIAAGENARGTMPFFESLPVPMWKAAAAKFFWAAVTVVLPIFLMVGFVYGLCQLWDYLGVDYLNYIVRRGYFFSGGKNGSWWVQVLVIGSLGSLSLLVWGAAAGVNRRDEVRAGAVAVLVIVCWFFALAQLGDWIVSEPGHPLLVWFATAASTGPAGPAFINSVIAREALAKSASPTLSYWLIVTAGVLSHSCLLGWYLMRFGRPGPSFVHSRKQSVVPKTEATWLAPPRRSKLSAIAWKQTRELGPLALAAVATIAGLSLITHLQSEYRLHFEQNLIVVTVMLGFFLVVVAGIGVFYEDLKPKVDTFWRSRPVNVHLWFWVKFLTGLVIIACALGTPVLFAYWRLGGRPPNSPDGGTMALFLLTLYCWSVAAICLVRRPVYAAIFSLASVILLPLAAHLLSHWVQVSGWPILIAMCVLTAWLAVRYNLGYKG